MCAKTGCLVALSSLAWHAAPASVARGEPMLYWGDRSDAAIYRAPIAGGEPEVVVEDLPQVQGVAIDPVRGRVIWADTALQAILSAELDGSNPQTLIENVGFPTGVWFDPAGDGTVYWTDPVFRQVKRFSLGQSDIEVVASDLNQPQDVKFEPKTGRVYWLEATVGIFSANPEGTGVASASPDFDGQAVVFAINPSRFWLYWGSAARLSRVSVFGGCQELFSPVLETLGGMAVDGPSGDVFWTIPVEGTVYRYAPGEDNATPIFTGLTEPLRLAIGPRFAAPTIVSNTTSALVPGGQEIVLTVEAAGSGPLTYNWERDGAGIEESSLFTGTSTSELRFIARRGQIEGLYTCTITGPGGSAETSPIPVAVRILCQADLDDDGVNTLADALEFIDRFNQSCDPTTP